MTQLALDYRVELDAYNGPLDLLLFLVKRHEINLHDISIAKLADQYLAFIGQLQKIDVDLAGEFLVMSATLLEIKSQMLVPMPQEESSETSTQTSDDSLDPRYELVQQLLAYKRFKDASQMLDEMRSQWEARVPCHPGRLARPRNTPLQEGDWDESEDAPEIEFDLEDASIHDLCAAFMQIIASIGDIEKSRHSVIYDDTPIGLHAEDIMDRIQRDGPITLQSVFAGQTRRVDMIGLFLATLELVRLKKVRVVQDEPGGDIQLQATPPQEQSNEQDSAQVDWRDPQTGQMQYDWPTEEARIRAMRRQKRREKAALKAQQEGQTDDLDEDDLDDDFDLDQEDGQAIDNPLEASDSLPTEDP